MCALWVYGTFGMVVLGESALEGFQPMVSGKGRVKLSLVAKADESVHGPSREKSRRPRQRLRS